MKNQADKALITIGHIGSAYGVRGWLKIYSYTELGTTILDYQPWYLETQHDWHPIDIEDQKIQHANIIIKITGINTPEEARLLTGKALAIPRSRLPILDPDQYYWSDLEGLTVVNINGIVLGKVIYLMATGSNDVLVVKGDTEQAIPYLPGKVIKKIDLANGQIIVDWEAI